LQVRCEPSTVLLDRHCRIAAETSVSTFERWLIDEVSQGKDSLFRMSFRSLRYLHESW
jgi:hypothetical protein